MIILTEQNFFQILKLPQSFDIKETDIANAKITMCKIHHPDHFTSCEAAEIELATKSTSIINQAAQTLKNKTLRALYLLSLNSIEITSQEANDIPQEMLSLFFEWQEQVEEVQSIDDCQKIAQELDAELSKNFSSLAQAFEINDFSAAKALYIKRKFLDRFNNNIEQKLESLYENI